MLVNASYNRFIIYFRIEHNVTNTLLDLGELDPYKNANTNLDISADKITNEDNVNSNNPAESHSTTGKLDPYT